MLFIEYEELNLFCISTTSLSVINSLVISLNSPKKLNALFSDTIENPISKQLKLSLLIPIAFNGKTYFPSTGKYL